MDLEAIRDRRRDSMRSATNDSMHKLIEKGNDLLKPINRNPTNPNVPNPFVQTHSERLKQLEQTVQNAAAHQGR
jgi:hypothetical protein